jgi:hypothetical protein
VIWHVKTYAPILIFPLLPTNKYYHGASGGAAILAALAVGEAVAY